MAGNRHRWRSSGMGIRLTLTVAALGFPACTTPLDDPCVKGGEGGAMYNVPLIERYLAESKQAQFLDAYVNRAYPSCGTLDGLAAGQKLAISVRPERVANLVGQSGCWVHPGTVTAPEGWSFGAEGSLATLKSSYVTFVYRMASRQSCTGGWYVILEAFGDPSREPNPEHAPPLLVRRHFITERAEDCPALAGKSGLAECEDVWVSSLRP